MKGRIVIISGPSGSGKTTLHKKLLVDPKFKDILVKSLSATTRPKREGEKHGRDYLFLTDEKFAGLKQRDKFLEWQKVFQHHYGTPRHNVDKLLKSGKNVLLCIDVKGAKVVAVKYPDALKIFIKTPSLTALKDRLKKRGTETKEDLRVRLDTARQELKEAKYYDYIVVNDTLSAAHRSLGKIIKSELFSSACGCGHCG